MGVPDESFAIARELQGIVDEHARTMSGEAHLQLSDFALRLYQILSFEPSAHVYHEHRDAEDDADSQDGDVDRMDWAIDVLSEDELHENDDARLRMPSPAERKLVNVVFAVDRATYTSAGARRYVRTELNRHMDPPYLIMPGFEWTIRRYNSVRACYNEAQLRFSDVLRVAYDEARILVMEERRFRHLRRDAVEEQEEGGRPRLQTFWLDRAYIERCSGDHPEYTIPETREEAILVRRVGGFHHHALRSPRHMNEEAGTRSVVFEGDILTSNFLVVTPGLVDLAKRVHRGAMHRIPVS
tara:strand:- start:462 stop:1355 length:894 start_codon:yes stop_codon:yes gene_type:complete